MPLSIVRRADVPLDGSAPALLYGYGSYEVSMDPAFSMSRLSLLDRGIVYAIAHIRGGGELGRSWYEQGKTLTKINTFTDFVACADYLVDHGYTTPDRLAARGGSAGGLLMGAVANLAPEKFRGDPRRSAVRRRADHDPGPRPAADRDRVGGVGRPAARPRGLRLHEVLQPVRERGRARLSGDPGDHQPERHPRLLRRASQVDRSSCDTPRPVAPVRAVLLKTEMVAGHGGVSGRYQSWRELAFEYAWIIDQISRAASWLGRRARRPPRSSGRSIGARCICQTRRLPNIRRARRTVGQGYPGPSQGIFRALQESLTYLMRSPL